MNIITGNPGTGKHTIAHRVAKNLGLELVDINKVAVEEKIFEKKGKVLDVDVGKLKKALAEKVSKKSLLVGHLAPYVVSKKSVEKAIVLRRSPYELERVYKKRKYDNTKLRENVGSEILGIIYYDTIKNIGANKTFQFDTTNSSISTITRKIESLIRKCKVKEDEVDWLALVLKNRDLQRFFSY